MSTTKLITMYLSPWSERVRWALAYKHLPYQKQDYRPGVDEEELKKLTGQAQVPVLVVDGKPIPDSTAILEWLEATHPEPALLPKDDRERAQVALLEELMLGVLGPHGRTLISGRLLRSSDPELQQAGQFFGGKYGHSQEAEEPTRLSVKRILGGLQRTLSGRQYLIGNTFTRADITTASMLMLLKPAADEFFVLSPRIRPMYTEPVAAAFPEVFTWRDEMYKRHRGEVVKP
jgi:glutathione S-transferase